MIVRRHGKKVRVRRRKTIHVIVPPHAVLKLKKRVAFGHTTTVSGWLGTYDGTALAGQAVEVLTAPNNGQERLHPGRVGDHHRQRRLERPAPRRAITTRRSQLPRHGEPRAIAIRPSHRDGAGEGDAAQHRAPTRAWGGRAAPGKLVGGYLPAGGALVRLRIGPGSARPPTESRST